MAHDWLLYLAVFACSFGVSIAVTPYTKTLAYKLGAVDYPRKRGMHDAPIPRIGGVAIVLGFLVAAGVAAIFVPELRTRQFIGFMAGAVIIAATGIADDIKNIKPGLKLAFQIVAALVVVFSGTRVDFINFPVPSFYDSLSVPFTVIWIVGLTNAVNIIDGLDGLAAGVSTIGAICLTILCIMTGSGMAVVFSAALAGCCLGFLPRNFNPAEVLMGDTGALFLGYVLAVSSIIGVFKGYAILSIVVACFALALPIFDTLFAMLRRFVAHRPIMGADRGHLHHRLIDNGYSHKQAVLLLYVLSAVTAVIAIVIAVQDTRAIVITAICVAITLTMVYVYRKRTS
ncbi:MAG: undecaprenyl/decaprenyl-phosphate alpha-N-acetylglucosaminyl 1-phosphate transferase [Clostridiales bacterium]|jgi:UDP-GlcNAc:undecaprenyl-phosphate GlcNAc-1-phosphate transferase|nr:undecaprenyl/decaprenyl-phosphate alpha-N-acetylglucosaminyl 1-phosphate transferase [Clostridiales bacterium]